MSGGLKLSPLPRDAVRSLVIMLAREGQEAITRRPGAESFAAQCFRSAASLAEDLHHDRSIQGDDQPSKGGGS